MANTPEQNLVFKDKWVLVTGASSGIGKAFVRRFAQDGAKIILVSRREDVLRKVAADLSREFGVETVVIAKDLSRLAASEELFNDVVSRGIHVEVLVNNAGFGISGKTHDLDFRKNQEQLLLNVVAVSSLTQLFIGPMSKRKSGAIINLASVAAFQPMPYLANYAASKAYVRAFGDAVAVEYVNDGVRVLTVCPGATETDFFNVASSTELDAMMGGRFDSPEFVVNKTLQALADGKTYVVPGVGNLLMTQANRFFTRRFVAGMVARVLKPKTSSRTMN